jgi:hypothetical protein
LRFVAGLTLLNSFTWGKSMDNDSASQDSNQNPSLLDPKVNYSWVSGRHSLKFGYECERVWMSVQNTDPLGGSYTFAGGFSRCEVGDRQPRTREFTPAGESYRVFGAALGKRYSR